MYGQFEQKCIKVEEKKINTQQNMICGKVVLLYAVTVILVLHSGKSLSVSPSTFGQFIAGTGELSSSIKVIHINFS